MMRSMLLVGVALSALAPIQAIAGPVTAAVPAPMPAMETPADAPGGGQAGPTEDIIITAPVQRREDEVLQGTSVLKGDTLTRSLRPTIGETLAQLPGVSATSFGPNSSRPVLRGLQGERIRVLTDGIGSIDVSNTSVDHAVAINPLLADRIEVLRGPAALLYGSSALGGVVNVIDSRIPRTIPDAGFRLNGIGTYGSAAEERTGQLAGDVAIGRLVLHADGSYNRTGDLRIGDFALTPQRRAEALASRLVPADPTDPEPIDFAANAAVRGRLPNTASETWTAGFGASLITDTGMIGVSYGHYDSLYGVPIRYATQIGEGQEAPRLDIVQNRVDLRAEVETGGGYLDRIKFRAGHATYRHFELEPDGEIATRFFNTAFEGRLEFVQAKRGVWHGASGVQYFNRQFNVDGEEAFLPRSETNQTGLFTLQQLDFGRFKAEAGARYEFTDLASRTVDGDLRFFNGTRDFGAFSGSLGGSYGLTEGLRAGVNLSYTERAPSAEELFGNGGHPATQAYELGNPNFRLERSVGIEATLHAHGADYSFDLAAYYNDFNNFISENQVDQAICEAAAAPSGRDVDLPCFQFLQGDARYYGVEAKGSVTLGQIADFKINADVLGDYVIADLANLGPSPRIPPARVLGGIEAQSERFNGRVEVEHVFAQNRLAAFESRTADYTMVNASIAFTPFGPDSGTTLLVSANNLFDVDARRHASFLKDFAPLAGRDIRVTARFGF